MFLYVPKLSCNLLSVGQAADQNMTVKFDQDKCYFKDSNGQMAATGTRQNRMYQLDFRNMNRAIVADAGNRLNYGINDWDTSMKQLFDK